MDTNWSDIIWYLFLGGMFIMMIKNGGCCGGHKKKTVETENSKETQK